MLRNGAVALAIALLLAGSAPAEPLRWSVVPARSEVSFVGDFPLGSFTGRTAELSGEFVADPEDLRQAVTGALAVKVTGLKTGNDGRDRDMYAALSAAQYPEIRFTVERVDPSFPSVTDRADVLVTIHGVMTIRGVERPMAIPGRVRLRDDTLWVRGESQLRMTDFGIEPPSRFLMKVKDTVRVAFDVTLAKK